MFTINNDLFPLSTEYPKKICFLGKNYCLLIFHLNIFPTKIFEVLQLPQYTINDKFL